ncbi:MAG TPA: tetratricopeptide repeat protein [Terriglobales bacterium]|nr:tetratricopeptide repeat protein [Terriglobales bacterium]
MKATSAMPRSGLHAISAVLLTLVLLAQPGGSRASQAPNTLPAPLRAADNHLRNLEYDAASRLFREWLGQHPDDLYAWNYLAVTTLCGEMFRRGVLETKIYGQGGEAFKPSKVPVTPEFQQELLSILERAQAIADQRLAKDPQDKEAMYWAGAAHGTRATYHFSLRREFKNALREADAAYKHHKQLVALDPNYVDAYLVLGVNNYVVGSLPWYWKVVAKLTGRSGDTEEGLRQVKRVVEHGHYAREDAKLMLAVLYEREKMYAAALALFQEMARSYPRNYLMLQEVASLHGQLNNWQQASAVYDSILAKYRAGERGYTNIPLARVLYHAGQAHERLKESELALAHYDECSHLNGKDVLIYRCELSAADIETRLNRPEAARQRYQHVLEAVPNSEEAKLAKKALKKLQKET